MANGNFALAASKFDAALELNPQVCCQPKVKVLHLSVATHTVAFLARRLQS